MSFTGFLGPIPSPQQPTGGAGNNVFYENPQTVTTNYTITTGSNAMSAGPITVAPGVTVTIPAGSTWRIV